MAKKHEDACCAYCERATVLSGTEYCICEVHGPVNADHQCSRFVMDLFKLPITPPPPFRQTDVAE